MKGKIDSIQVLRAFAALAVVHFHTQFTIGSWHTFGAFGVDIFFVISGFIMAMICAANTRDFLIRRLIRIVPLYWLLTLVFYAALVTHPAFDAEVKRGLPELLKSLFFIPYARYDGTKFPILVVGWSLNYEMCFYLILSIAIMVSKKRAAITGAILLMVLMFTLDHFPSAAAADFYSSPIMLEFVGGIGAFWVYTAMSQKKCAQIRPIFYAIGLFSIGFLAWYEGARYYLPTGTRAGLGIPAFFLMLSVVLISKSGKDWNWPLFVLLGDASYALYLTHTFVVSGFKHIVAWRLPLLDPATILGMASAMVLSSVVAIGVHLFLDRPTYRYLNHALLHRRRGVLSPVR